jgi:tRNA threonylcarbamoyladenosine biosynthesis protein TsaB
MDGILLAVDTSTRVASVALYDGVNVRAEATWESPRRHTIELAPRVAAMLDQRWSAPQSRIAGQAPTSPIADLGGLAVALGPGSYTGLRIGMALVKGLALARGIPLVGVPTLDVAVYPVRGRRGTLFATLQAGRGRICVAPYRWRRRRWRCAGETRITTWPELAAEIAEADRDATLCGELDARGLEALADAAGRIHIVPPARRLRRAGYLAELAWERLVRDDADDPAGLQPIYLHTV